MKECAINEFLSVRGGGDQWDICIAGSMVHRATYDLYNIPPDIILKLDKYISAYDYSLDWKYEKTDFESACKILKIWYENNYNTNIGIRTCKSLSLLFQLIHIPPRNFDRSIF